MSRHATSFARRALFDSGERLPEIWSTAAVYPPETALPLLDQSQVRTSDPYGTPVDLKFAIGASVEVLESAYLPGGRAGLCAWAAAAAGENGPGEFVRFATTADFVTWSAPQTLAPDPEPDGDRCRSHGMFFKVGGTVYYLGPKFLGSGAADILAPELVTELWRADVAVDGTISFVAMGEVTEPGSGGWPLQKPILMDDGNWICGCGDDYARPCVLISRGNDILRWDRVSLLSPSYIDPALSETNLWVDGPRVTAVIRQPGSKYPTLALTAVSQDYGRSWTRAGYSNLIMQSKKPHLGVLSTGQRYGIFSVYGLDNIVICVTQPGEEAFRHVWEVLTGTPPDPVLSVPPVAPNLAGWGYADAVEVEIDGEPCLYTAFYNAKETIWGRYFPLSLLTRQVEQSTAVARWKLGDAADGAAPDSSGNGYGGTVHGTPLPAVAGPFADTAGLAIGEAGTYVTFPQPEAYNSLNDFTAACWWRLGNSDAGYRTLMGAWGAGHYQWKFGVSNSGAPGRLYLSISPKRAATNVRVQVYDAAEAGVWHHTAVTWSDLYGASLYLDGVLQTPVSVTGDIPNSVYKDAGTLLYVGAEEGDMPGTAKNGWNGSLYDARIFNRALTAGEMAALAGVPG